MYARGYLQGSENVRVVTIGGQVTFGSHVTTTMRRTYFRTWHVTGITSGHVTDVTSCHVTFGQAQWLYPPQM